MATTYKVLGQLLPTGNTATSAYAVPASKQAIVSSITVCNNSAATQTYSIAVRVANAATPGDKQFIAKAIPIAPLTTITYTIGVTLATTDAVWVTSSTTGAVSFNLFGSELDA
jgi:hypothetical protein